jgi:hypothetical protein
MKGDCQEVEELSNKMGYIFGNHISDKGFLSGMYENTHVNLKKTTQSKKYARI